MAHNSLLEICFYNVAGLSPKELIRWSKVFKERRNPVPLVELEL
jgi:hypothetical protein